MVSNKWSGDFTTQIAAVLFAGSASVLAVGSNTGINVQTDINQKQECDTAGGTSAITSSCHATSTNTVTQSGGIH
ncbi:MAG: hypothetical protein WAM14_10790 [Candidatus Nitrosopolaris sp.]